MRLIFIAALLMSLTPACASTAGAPQVIRASEADADCVIRVLVDRRGRPIDIAVERPCNDPQTDRAVLKAARSWKYPPEIVGGKPQQTWHLVPVRLASP